MENKPIRSNHPVLKGFSNPLILLSFIVLALCAFLLVQCSAPNANAPSANSVHPKMWTDPVLKGTKQYHGTFIQANGTDSCKTCHGTSLQGTSNIKGCSNACHFGPGGERAPKGAGWVHGSAQHSGPSADMAVCNTCHNILRQYSMGPSACHDCHSEGVNHPLGKAWLDPKSTDFHGGSGLNCASCHNPVTACTQCHFGPAGSRSPAGSDWVHGNNESHKSYEADQQVCNQCHGLNRSYRNPPKDCHDCHEITPDHPLGQLWLDQKSLQFHGKSSLECASCHTISSYCLQCHFDASGSRVPPGLDWTHGYNNAHKDYSFDQNTCNECHNLNRSYGNPPSDCHDCHEMVVNHPLGQSWLDTNSAQFHGDSSLNCSSCHNLSTDCNQCHFGSSGSKAPVGSGWHHGDNERHEDYESYQNTCNGCHNLNRSYGNPPSRCHDCHDD